MCVKNNKIKILLFFFKNGKYVLLFYSLSKLMLMKHKTTNLESDNDKFPFRVIWLVKSIAAVVVLGK